MWGYDRTSFPRRSGSVKKSTKVLLIIGLGILGLYVIGDYETKKYRIETATPFTAKELRDAQLVAGQIQNALLASGIDAQAQAAGDDPKTFFIFGPSINRSTAYQLIKNAKLRRIMAVGKYTQVTFMNSFTDPTFNEDYSLVKAQEFPPPTK
jgi:hypothetical protein